MLAATLVLALTVEFFLRGGAHGLYSDEYTHKALAFDFSALRPRPNLNPIMLGLRSLHAVLTPNLASMIPEYELPTRLGIVLVHLFNVLLLAMLAYQLTTSGLIAVLGGAYFLIPVFANEALLWLSAVIPHVMPLFLSLVGLHLVLSCHSVRRHLLLLVGAVLAWALMILGGESNYFTLLLLPVFVGMRWHRGERVSHAVWILALTASYILLGLYLLRLVL